MRWLIVLAACSHPAPSPKPAAPANQCALLADHLVALMPAAEKLPDQVDPFRKLIFQHCDRDGWTPDAQRCFLGLASLDDDHCTAYLTAAQQSGIRRDGDKAADDLAPKQ
jgi:hypothetical protein